MPRSWFSSVFNTINLAFLDALPPSVVWLPWDGCGYYGAMAIHEPIGHPLRLLSELTSAFDLGGKGKRTCVPMRFDSSLAIHLCKMAEIPISGSIAGV